MEAETGTNLDEPIVTSSVTPEALKVEAESSLEDKVRAAVKAAMPEWIMSNVHSSPIARYTEAYNHLMAVLPSLEGAIVRKL